ncbi:hypothetical protein AB0395_34830 [Streptosporangium sp. NPDC051023]|uniref:hypothetical protein n=1 Tax=Streptosporangium sp. NPDC051023 TaxID=3155410 RepID=UPI00344B00C6
MRTVTVNEITVEVVVNRADGYGRRVVRRADNNRQLGWATTEDGQFRVYIHAGAFRGDDVNDEGDALDEVPDDLTNASAPYQHEPISQEARLGWVLEDLVDHLDRHRAPAVGHPRHPRVARWADRHR